MNNTTFSLAFVDELRLIQSRKHRLLRCLVDILCLIYLVDVLTTMSVVESTDRRKIASKDYYCSIFILFFLFLFFPKKNKLKLFICFFYNKQYPITNLKQKRQKVEKKIPF